MELTCFDVTTKDKVAHVQLNRPDALNTMIPAFWTELPQLIGELSDSGEVRAIVISSTGKHFSAGMDLSVFTSSGLSMDGEPGRRNATMSLLVKRLQDSFTALERARVPVLVAIQGGCIGGAVDMVCAADMRYATADAYFVVQETNIGMTADVGTLQRLPKLIPDGIARELVYTGRRMPAARAAQVGLVNEVFDDHESMVAGVLAIAAEIAAHSPLTLWGAKEALVYARDHGVHDSLHQIATWQSGAFQPADMMEAFGAKAEKRQATFEDLPPAPSGI
ncbi:MAG TPA: crotonase/enoyl-CoA hydratase family protein [Actinomycetota bacterium]|jgi:enoyl-CoA hydratase|nr:crotonase/enoyl-CoA hydratase family protein [Actinomycetota bacterium]